MSEFHVRIVKIEKIENLPNSDFLAITTVEGYPTIIKRGAFNEGDLAVYVPIDSLVPLDRPEFSFLQKEGNDKQYHRIRAAKKRGVFSMGMIAPLPDRKKEYHVGDDVQEEMGIAKWEPQPDGHSTREVLLDAATITWNKKPLWKKLLTVRFYRRAWWNFLRRFKEKEIICSQFPVYTDLEGLRKYSSVLIPGEEVIVTEKTHGQNARFGRLGKKFFVGSHYTFKTKPKWSHDKINNWWQIANAYNLHEILPDGFGFYGEIYGAVQKGFGYDAPGKLAVRFFDIINFKTGTYLDYDDFVSMCTDLNLPMMPVLFRGPWSEELRSLAEGKSTFGEHTREGFVVRPAKERHSPSIGRCALKLVGEGYLLSKNT